MGEEHFTSLAKKRESSVGGLIDGEHGDLHRYGLAADE